MLCGQAIKYNHDRCIKTNEHTCCVGCDKLCELECESAWFYSYDEPCHHAVPEKGLLDCELDKHLIK